jgi:Xaa-Pro aminopeptidase
MCTPCPRCAPLRQALQERELDGILISQPENRRYLSGFAGSAGYLLITAQDKVLALQILEAHGALLRSTGHADQAAGIERRGGRHHRHARRVDPLRCCRRQNYSEGESVTVEPITHSVTVQERSITRLKASLLQKPSIERCFG